MNKNITDPPIKVMKFKSTNGLGNRAIIEVLRVPYGYDIIQIRKKMLIPTNELDSKLRVKGVVLREFKDYTYYQVDSFYKESTIITIANNLHNL